MSEARDLLNGLSEAEYASYSEVAPINDVLLINAETRTIDVPSTEILFGVETDKDVERKYFRCPRIVGDNIDLSTLQLRVHYQNANGDRDKYIAEDVTVDGDYITFSWVLSGKVLKYKGSVQFTIVAVSINQDGTLNKEWNTTLASGTVLEGLEVEDLDEGEEQQARDVLLQLLNMLDDKADESIQKVQTEGTTQIQRVQSAAEELIATIPADYKTVITMAEEGIRSKADAIVETIQCETIIITDSSDDRLQNLRVFGKTVQTDVPTPDTPQELMSLEKLNVDVYGRNLASNITDSTSTHNGITITTKAGSSEVIINGTASTQFSYKILQERTLPPGKYTISVSGLNHHNSSTDRLYVYDTINAVGIVNYVQSDYPKTFELIDVTTFRVDAIFAADTTYNNQTISIQIEPGESFTEYESGKNIQTIQCSRVLSGIPVSDASIATYTDADGQMWVADEINHERGVYIQRILKINLLDYIDHAIIEDNTAYSDTIIRCEFYNADEMHKLIMMCDRFPYIWAHEPVTIPEVRKCECVSMHSVDRKRISLFIDKTRLISNDVNGIRAYLTENTVNVMIALVNPIETPLTAVEIEAYKALHTNKLITTVYNNVGATMEVNYNVDTKTYINTHGGGGSSTATKDEVTLLVANWITSDDESHYTQTVELDDITNNTKVDLDPTPDQLVSLINDGISMCAINENGSITIYAFGDKPTSDMTISVIKSEVVYV